MLSRWKLDWWYGCLLFKSIGRDWGCLTALVICHTTVEVPRMFQSRFAVQTPRTADPRSIWRCVMSMTTVPSPYRPQGRKVMRHSHRSGGEHHVYGRLMQLTQVEKTLLLDYLEHLQRSQIRHVLPEMILRNDSIYVHRHVSSCNTRRRRIWTMSSTTLR